MTTVTQCDYCDGRGQIADGVDCPECHGRGYHDNYLDALNAGGRKNREAAEAAATMPPTYRATRLADVEPERVRWLWPDRWPLGKLVTLDGDPDIGKSTLCVDIAARVSTGRWLPEEEYAAVPASDVVLMAAEDGLADTIRPRLDAAGADVARVHHLDAVTRYTEDGTPVTEPPTLPEDIPALQQLVKDTGAVLVIVDVLMAYLSGRTDSHRDQDVRRALMPLAEMAERMGACVVLLRHVPKSQRRAGQAIAAGSGAIGIVGAARAGMVAAPDPEDPDRRILARAKGNLAPPYPSLAYRLVNDDERDCARVEWLGEVELTGDQLLAPRESDDDRSALEEAQDWLRAMLSDGPMLKRDLTKLARSEGITEVTLRRARERLGVASERDDSQQGRPSTWSLPEGYESRVTSQPDVTRNGQRPDQGNQPESEGYRSQSDNDPKPVSGAPVSWVEPGKTSRHKGTSHTLEYNADGWKVRDLTARPETCCCQLELANAGLPPCFGLTVWKHSRHRPGRYGGRYMACYCDEHLPDECRQHLPDECRQHLSEIPLRAVHDCTDCGQPATDLSGLCRECITKRRTTR